MANEAGSFLKMFYYFGNDNRFLYKFLFSADILIGEDGGS